MPEELWMVVRDTVQEAVIKTIPKKKKCKKAKWLSEEVLKITEKREAQGNEEKERYTHLNAKFQRIARRDKKAFLTDQCKEIEDTLESERLEISSRKLEIPREYFMQVKSEVAQSCPTLCDAMDCSPPGFSIHGIFQA